MNPAALRSVVARFLTDSCTIATPGADPVFNPSTGYSDADGDEVYDGPCRLRPSSGSTVDAGGAVLTLHRYDLTVPWDTTGLTVGQVVTITDSNDPSLVGRTYRIVDVQGGTDTPHRRAVVEDTLEVGEMGS
jgi:hypothetical protein